MMFWFRFISRTHRVFPGRLNYFIVYTAAYNRRCTQQYNTLYHTQFTWYDSLLLSGLVLNVTRSQERYNMLWEHAASTETNVNTVLHYA